MKPITFLVASTDDRGIKDAMDRGWVRVARTRFAVARGCEVRVVRRVADLLALLGGTPMIKGSDYEDGPDGASEAGLMAWIAEKERFDEFVAQGAGFWVEGVS